jgi:uncharacterized membrane protein
MNAIIFLTLFNVLLMALGQLLWKHGMRTFEIIGLSDLVRAVFSPFIILGLAVYALSMLLWLFILSKAELNYVYPIQSLSFVIVVVVSSILFAESLPVNRIIGVLFICFGAFLVSIR